MVWHCGSRVRAASACRRDGGLLGEYGKSASWEEGVFENEYVKRDGVWMIKSLHLYVTFIVPYEKGWARATSTQTDNRSRVARELPPDRPSSAPDKRFPESRIVPFHYSNPAKAAPAKQPPSSK